MSKLYTDSHAATEQAIVQTCLVHPERIVDATVEPQHFASMMYRDAWRIMQALDGEGKPVSPIIVADMMREEGNVGIRPGDLVGDSQGMGVVEVLSSRLRDAHTARSVAFACSEVLARVESGLSGSEALTDVLGLISAIDIGKPVETMTVRDLILARFEELNEMAAALARGEQVGSGIPTGLEELDEMLGGFQIGVVTTVGARPGMGKSAFAMAATDGATAAGFPAHVFSLEDTRQAYSDRLIARACRVAVSSLRTGQFNAGDLQNFANRGASLAKRKGWIVDERSGITAEEIVRTVRREARKNGTKLVIVDYLQLVTPSAKGSRHEQLGNSLQVFANAAKQDGMAYVVLSQLNRGLEQRDNKRPLMQDLKESGDIEDKSKAILFLYRGEVYGDMSNGGKVEILIGKNNQGPCGFALANWDPEHIRIF